MNNTEAEPVHANRVAIIGCGNVGTTTAFALMRSGLLRELVLVDRNADKAEGEAMDLRHAVPLGTPVRVWAGDYRDAAQSSIVVITAGTAGEPGESRLDLIDRNATVVRECVRQLAAANFGGVLLVTTNPVDVLATVAKEESGLPAHQVISSGTLLDTARLRYLLGEELGVEARAVHAFIIGEHGDSEVAAWSCANVAGIPLTKFGAAGEAISTRLGEILNRVRRAAPEVVERKGNTSYGIASCVTRICEAVLRDEHTVLAVSALMQGEYGIEGVYLGTPCVVGRRGIEQVIELPLDETELNDLRASAEVLRKTLRDSRRE